MSQITDISLIERGPGGGPKGIVPQDRRQELEVFIRLVSSIYVKDYGDFKRQVSGYVDRLRGDLQHSSQAVQTLDRMKHYLVYDPDFEIETTRRRLLSDAESLRSIAAK